MAAELGSERATRSLAVVTVARLRRHKLAVAGLVIIGTMVVFCVVGPLLYRTNQTNVLLALRNGGPKTCPCAPSVQHLLGTDAAGFDILGRLMFAGRQSLELGFAAALIATGFGVVYGAVSGLAGGAVDAVMMRVLDVLMSVPLLFLLLALTAVLRPSATVLLGIIAFSAWFTPARLIRGETLSLRVREYVLSARTMGASRRHIVFRHIIPNAGGTILVNVTLQVADAILLLAALGFLGLGLRPPQTDWGAMLNDGVSFGAGNHWWLIFPAGLCIVLVVVGLNLVGDGIRDAFDTRGHTR